MRLTLTHRNKTKGEKWKVIQLKTEFLLLLLFIQSYPTLWDPMDYSPPGTSVLGISQARILEQVAIYFSRGSFNPGVELGFPALQMDSLSSEPPGLTHSFFFFIFFFTLFLYDSYPFSNLVWYVLRQGQSVNSSKPQSTKDYTKLAKSL